MSHFVISLPIAILTWGKHSCLPFQIAIAEPAANWTNKEVLIVRPTFVALPGALLLFPMSQPKQVEQRWVEGRWRCH